MQYWLLIVTFISVNLDFFVMLIFLVKKYALINVILGYVLGNILLLSLSFFVGRTLALFLPEWILGILGFLPIWMALRQDDDDQPTTRRKGQISAVLLTYLSVCLGCNLAIFLPVLVGQSFENFLITVGLISLLSILGVLLIKGVSELKVVTRFMEKYGEKVMRICYVMIGLYVFWDSGLISHLIMLFN